MQKLKNEEKKAREMGGKQNKRNESKIKIIRKGLEIFFVLSSLLFFSSFFLIFFSKVKMKIQGVMKVVFVSSV